MQPDSLTADYLQRCRALLDAVAQQTPAIQQTAGWFAQTILAGRMVHLFGSGHSRILVEEMIRDEFVSLVAKHAKPWTPSDPLDPNTSMGAVVDNDQMTRVLGYIEEGRKEGATIAADGAQARKETGGAYIEPTVFTGVSNASHGSVALVNGQVVFTPTNSTSWA